MKVITSANGVFDTTDYRDVFFADGKNIWYSDGNSGMILVASFKNSRWAKKVLNTFMKTVYPYGEWCLPSVDKFDFRSRGDFALMRGYQSNLAECGRAS